MTLERYKNLVKDELNAVMETVVQVLNYAGLHPSDIDELQMVGGSSFIPILPKMFKEMGFTRDKIHCVEPMYAVAKGAALLFN